MKNLLTNSNQIESQKKLSDLYILYFNLQEELYLIQDSRDSWPIYSINSYEEMAERVNYLMPKIRTVAADINCIF